MRKLVTLALAVVAAAAGPCRAAGGPGDCRDCNIIFLSLGNVGTQHMSAYGYGRKTTPNIDRWAAKGVVFENAFSHASWTLPVAASLFTSLYPYTHGVVKRDFQNSLSTAILTLPEVLRDRGYRTAAFTGGLDYYGKFSTMRGFEEVADNRNYTGLDVTLAQARNWLRKNGDRRFFVFIHGYDAHCPFTPPASARGVFTGPGIPAGVHVDPTRCVRGFLPGGGKPAEALYISRCNNVGNHEPCLPTPAVRTDLTPADVDYLRDLYDETILGLDAHVGEFLDSLDKRLLRKTVIVLLAEHGEMFAKHGRFGRAGATRGTHYDDVLHIPLMMWLPGVPSRRVSGLAQLIDLMPTVLALTGIPLPQRVQGRSLLPMVRGGGPVNEYVFAGLPYNTGWAPYYFDAWSLTESVRSREWKLIREYIRYRSFAWKFQTGRLTRVPFDRWSRLFSALRHPFDREEVSTVLYHVSEDPQEQRDLAAQRPEVLRKMQAVLDRWRDDAHHFTAYRPETKPVPKRLLDDAQRRGYW